MPIFVSIEPMPYEFGRCRSRSTMQPGWHTRAPEGRKSHSWQRPTVFLDPRVRIADLNAFIADHKQRPAQVLRF